MIRNPKTPVLIIKAPFKPLREAQHRDFRRELEVVGEVVPGAMKQVAKNLLFRDLGFRYRV